MTKKRLLDKKANVSPSWQENCFTKNVLNDPSQIYILKFWFYQNPKVNQNTAKKTLFGRKIDPTQTKNCFYLTYKNWPISPKEYGEEG